MTEDQIPSWSWHQARLTPTTIAILTRLDALRCEHPILWALCTASTPCPSISIANRLGMPHEPVLYELRRYKKENLVTDRESPRGIVWRLLSRDHLELWSHTSNLRYNNRINIDNRGNEG